MAGVKGAGGKSFQDRELAARVRTFALELSEEALKGKGMGEDVEFRKALLLKFAGTLLPRIQELSDPNGNPIPLSFIFTQAAELRQPEPILIDTSVPITNEHI